MEHPTLALDNKILAFSPGTAHTDTKSCVTSGLLEGPAHSTQKTSSGFFLLTPGCPPLGSGFPWPFSPSTFLLSSLYFLHLPLQPP